MPPLYDGTPKSWAELNRWAMHKIHGWREVDTVSTIQGLTETEKLRLLAFVMLNDSCHFRNKAIRAAETNPAPIFFKPNAEVCRPARQETQPKE